MYFISTNVWYCIVEYTIIYLTILLLMDSCQRGERCGELDERREGISQKYIYISYRYRQWCGDSQRWLGGGGQRAGDREGGEGRR